MKQSPATSDPKADRQRLQRYRALLAAQTDRDIRGMLKQLIDETEERLSVGGSRSREY